MLCSFLQSHCSLASLFAFTSSLLGLLYRSFRMIDFARVQKELQECSRDIEASGITVTPKSENLARLTGTIPGPIGTPYEGGIFQIDISLPGIYASSLLHHFFVVSLGLSCFAYLEFAFMLNFVGFSLN